MPAAFILRRLHSLCGLIPLGAFLICHLYSIAFSLSSTGVRDFNAVFVGGSSHPFLFFFKILFLYLPFAFYVIYGLILLYASRGSDAGFYSGSHFRFVMQRVTGIIGLFFVGYHVAETSVAVYGTDAVVDYLWMGRLFEVEWKALFYLVGGLAVGFHFFNGVWAGLIRWGITVSQASQRVSLGICMGGFFLVGLVYVAVVWRFAGGFF